MQQTTEEPRHEEKERRRGKEETTKAGEKETEIDRREKRERDACKVEKEGGREEKGFGKRLINDNKDPRDARRISEVKLPATSLAATSAIRLTRCRVVGCCC